MKPRNRNILLNGQENPGRQIEFLKISGSSFSDQSLFDQRYILTSSVGNNQKITSTVTISGSADISGSLLVTGSLEVGGNSSYFKIPNITDAQKTAIPSPSAGMIIYNVTSSSFCVYTDAWKIMTVS